MFPFSAITKPTRRTSFQTCRSPSPGFLNLSTGTCADTGLQVCSTLQALLGYGLQSLRILRSTTVTQLRASTLLPTLHGFLPSDGIDSRVHYRRWITRSATFHCSAPCSLSRTGYHLELQPTLKFYSRPITFSTVTQFHPNDPGITLLAFIFFRDSSSHHG